MLEVCVRGKALAIQIRLIPLRVHLCLCNSHSPTLYQTVQKTRANTGLSHQLMEILSGGARGMSQRCHTQQHMTHECWHMANRLLLLYTVSGGGGVVSEVCGGRMRRHSVQLHTGHLIGPSDRING